MIRYLTILIVILAVSEAHPRDLSLDEAIRLAENHSALLSRSSALAQAADQTASAAATERFPTLSLDARASYIDDIPSLDIAIPGLADLSRELGSNETYQTDLRLSVPLWTGGRLGSAIGAAQAGSEQATAGAELTRQQVQLQTRLDYFNLYRVHQLHRAAEASLRRTSILRDDVLAGYDAGVADSVDLLDVNLAYTRADLLVRQAETAIEEARIELLNRLGLPLDETVRLLDSLPDPPLPVETDRRGESRPDLRAAGAAVRVAEKNLSGQKAAWLPTLAAFGGYSYGKPNNDLFHDEWTDYFTFGANLTWSLNLGFGNANRTQAAAARLDAARSQYRYVDESVDRELDLAFQRLGLAHTRFLNSREQLKLTKDSYRLARMRHQNGSLSANRLLEIETDLTRAEAGLTEARAGYYLAQSAYFFAASDPRLGKGL